jgi:hypothetical protein
MPFIAISYDVRPGHDDEIADIFAERSFTRADTPVLRDENGVEVGRNLATGLFIQRDVMARIVQFEGDVRYIGRHMSGQQGVKEAERRLAAYLAVPRDTQNPEGFMTYFRNARMEGLFQRETEPGPGQIAALRYTIKPQYTDQIRNVFAALHPGVRFGYTGVDSPIIAEGVFTKGSTMVRMLSYQGDIDDVASYLTRTGQGPQAERELTPYLAEDRPAVPVQPYSEVFAARCMRTLQYLSVNQPPVRV